MLKVASKNKKTPKIRIASPKKHSTNIYLVIYIYILVRPPPFGTVDSCEVFPHFENNLRPLRGRHSPKRHPDATKNDLSRKKLTLLIFTSHLVVVFCCTPKFLAFFEVHNHLLSWLFFNEDSQAQRIQKKINWKRTSKGLQIGGNWMASK